MSPLRLFALLVMCLTAVLLGGTLVVAIMEGIR